MVFHDSQSVPRAIVCEIRQIGQYDIESATAWRRKEEIELKGHRALLRQGTLLRTCLAMPLLTSHKICASSLLMDTPCDNCF